MVLSRTEKEQHVINLYEQGKPVREISHEVHMSFVDIYIYIGGIIRKLR
jgi:DNA-binding NarL/FixJ family response regulator